jgi:hypothetical protein
MSRIVPHHRPELADGIRVSLPVGSFDWAAMAMLANFCNGHGGMLIPWAALGQSVSGGSSATFHFNVAPKLPAVERVWVVNLRTSAAVGITAAVTVGGASAVTVYPSDVRDARTTHIFRESLSSKTGTVADTSLVVAATGGTVTVESVGMFEQARSSLDATTDDYGVDVTTLRARSPIADLDYQSIAGVIDAYKNLDARRAGFFHWATDASSAIAITAGSGSPVAVFDLSIPMTGAIPTLGDTTTLVTVAVLGKVDAGTGTVRFQSDDAGASVNVEVTQTAYTTWATKTLSINCEDLTVSDGRRGSTWEGVAVDAWVTATDTFNVQAISIYRPSSSNPI